MGFKIVSTIGKRGNKYYCDFNASADKARRTSKANAPEFDRGMAEKILQQLQARDNSHEWALEDTAPPQPAD